MKKLNIDNKYLCIKDNELIKIKILERIIIVPEGVTKIKKSIYEPLINYSDWKNSQTIEEIILPATLTEIEPSAFINCYLRKIKLPENLKTIGSYAFIHNDNIQIIELSDELENIATNAFVINLERDPINKTEGYVTKLPKIFIINYKNYDTLNHLLNKLFASNTFNFKGTNIPEFELKLVGPLLSEIKMLRIYRKLLLTQAKNITFILPENRKKFINQINSITNEKNQPKK